MIKRLRQGLAISFIGLSASLLPVGDAQCGTTAAWPERAITMVVPFPGGGPTDMVARLLAKQLSGQLGKPVVVQNMPGAAGLVAMRNVAKASNDGHTFMYNTSSLVLSPILYPDPGFDPLRDFVAVSSTAIVPLVLLVHPSLPIQDFRSFVAYARERPGMLSYASAGAGNVTHLGALLLLRALDIDATHVPYGGSARASIGLIGGHTDFMLNTVNDSLGPIQQGKLRALAVTARARVEALPEIATIDESGIKDFEVGAWQGVVAPAETPPDVVARLNAEIRKALASKEVRERLAGWGAKALGSSPQDYARYVREEYARWATIVQAAGIGLD